jgi:hypothetical protein
MDGFAARATALTVTASDAKTATALRTGNRAPPSSVRIEFSDLAKANGRAGWRSEYLGRANLCPKLACAMPSERPQGEVLATEKNHLLEIEGTRAAR